MKKLLMYAGLGVILVLGTAGGCKDGVPPGTHTVEDRQLILIDGGQYFQLKLAGQWVDVTQKAYNGCPKGAIYPECAK